MTLLSQLLMSFRRCPAEINDKLMNSFVFFDDDGSKKLEFKTYPPHFIEIKILLQMMNRRGKLSSLLIAKWEAWNPPALRMFCVSGNYKLN